jgi:hypothetical protein
MHKLFEKQILRTIQKHAEEKQLLNSSHFDFRADRSTTPNLNNNMSTAAVFLDIKESFDTTWHPSLIYKLSEFEFSTSLIELFLFSLRENLSLGRR